MNRSKFAVTNVSGEVDWMKGDVKIGSTVFSLVGSIPAGDTKMFATTNSTLTSTTIRGAADSQVVRFTQVEIVE
jgi:hypothetical protein